MGRLFSLPRGKILSAERVRIWDLKRGLAQDATNPQNYKYCDKIVRRNGRHRLIGGKYSTSVRQLQVFGPFFSLGRVFWRLCRDKGHLLAISQPRHDAEQLPLLIGDARLDGGNLRMVGHLTGFGAQAVALPCRGQEHDIVLNA